MSKELGKIASVKYGFGGYQDVQFGISFTLEMNGSAIGDFWGFWGHEPLDSAEWDESDQEAFFGETAMRICKLLQQAKIRDVMQLEGVPIEVELERRQLKSWRILEEVL